MAMLATSTFRMDRIRAGDTTVKREPFPFIVATKTVEEDQRASLDADFRRFGGTGYFPFEAGDTSAPAVRKLIDEITSNEVADALGDELGIDRLSQYPTLGYDRSFTQSAAWHHPHG